VVYQAEIHRKANSVNEEDRREAAKSLGRAFAYVPNKEEAWKDLHSLASDADSDVRWSAAQSLGLAFAHIPNKEEAWKDLHSLASDADIDVRTRAAESLGRAFALVPNKEEAWKDLHSLASDADKYVRMYAYHSLGRASVFKATETKTDDDLKRYLEEAIGYFERSATESLYSPARFCYPFYSSYFLIVIQGAKEEEVKSHLEEAKKAIGQSKNKEILLEAVENLAQAILNVQRAKIATHEERRLYLDSFRQSCERAAGLLTQAEDCAPGAVKTIRRGLPIIDRKLKAILREIESEGDKLLEATKETPFKALGARTQERIKGLSRVEYEFNAETIMDEVVEDIRVMCTYLPEKSRASVCELQNWEILDFRRKATLFKRAISHCSNQMENYYQKVQDSKEQIIFLRNEVLARLDAINHHVFKLNIQSANAAQSLRALGCELEKIKKIKSDLDRLGLKLDDLGISQQQALGELSENLPRILNELEMIARDIDDPNTKEILDKLNTLKKSPIQSCFDRIYFGQVADVASVVSFLLYIIDKLASSGAIPLPR